MMKPSVTMMMNIFLKARRSFFSLLTPSHEVYGFTHHPIAARPRSHHLGS